MRMARLILLLLLVILALPLCAVSYSFDLQDRALAGDIQAQFELGVCYDFGFGIYENDAEAAIWYRLAAMMGHAEAQYFLATAYDEGRGVEHDPKQAYTWYQRAAEQNHAAAQFNLGVAYFNGDGVKPDQLQSYVWLLIAATNGDPEAESYLPDVGARLSAVEIRAAQGQASLWLRERATAETGQASADRDTTRVTGSGANGILILQFAGAYDFPLSASALQALRAASRVPISDGAQLLTDPNQINLGPEILTRICLKRDGRVAVNYSAPEKLSHSKLKRRLRQLHPRVPKAQSAAKAQPARGFLIAAEDETQTKAIAKLLKLLQGLDAKQIMVRRAGADPIQPE